MIKFEKDLKNQIKKILKENYDISEIEIQIENPKDISHGVFSSNIALVANKKIGKNPRELASEIISSINDSKIEGIEKIDVAGPGFINFYMNENFYLNQIKKDVIKYDLDPADDDKYLIEYVSANPTGDLHLGHARNAIYGSSLVNVLRKANYNVDTEYYLNDAGNQMDNLGYSVQYFYLEMCGIECDFPNDGYKGQDIQSIAKEIFDTFADEKCNESMEYFKEYGYQINLKNIKQLLLDLNIEFDNWTSERDLYASKKVENSLNVLEKRGDIFEDDGAIWLKTSKYEDDKDRVLRKQDGSYTYFTADIAYHIDKYNRGYNHLIDIWGADHHGYIPRVKSAIESLGEDKNKFEVPLIQMVSIMNNNVAVKMSKRAGTSVTINQILKDIDKDSLRYFFVMRSPDTQLDFDIEVAKKKDIENPIYYIQYASARMNSVLNKFKEDGYKINNNIINLSDIEKEIILILAKYQKVIGEAARKRSPHLICNYLFELASMFHKYYNQEKVFDGNLENINKKVFIYNKILSVLTDGLCLIGIEAKKTM